MNKKLTTGQCLKIPHINIRPKLANDWINYWPPVSFGCYNWQAKFTIDCDQLFINIINFIENFSPHTVSATILVNGVATSTITSKLGKFGRPLIKIFDEILTQAKITESKISNELFDEFYEKIEPLVPLYNRGTKMNEAILAMIEKRNLKMKNQSKITIMFLKLDEELKMDVWLSNSYCKINEER